MITEAIDLFRRDAARWLRPEEVADVDEVTPFVALGLYFRHPPLRAMAWFRAGAAARQLGIRGAAGFVQRRLLLRYGFEIAPSTPVGGGLYVAHPVGCVLHAESIGENVTVVGAATFGTRDGARWPRIGDRAFIGVGARVLGDISLGAGAVVGANAVVLDDVDDGVTVVGLPARPVSADR